MVKIASSVIPQGWNGNNQNTQNKPVDNKARTTYPEGYSEANMQNWFGDNRISKSYIAPGHMKLIDNMNKHLFQ